MRDRILVIGFQSQTEINAPFSWSTSNSQHSVGVHLTEQIPPQGLVHYVLKGGKNMQFLDKEFFGMKFGELLLICLCLVPMIFSGNSRADTLEGITIGCTDGDTLTILDANKQQHVIRLFAIDSPETSCHAQTDQNDGSCVEQGQPFGKAAKRSLCELTFQKSVIVETQPGNSYGREIGTVWAGPINVNLEQVKRGYAWMYRQYAKRGLFPDEYAEMEHAEHEAQENGLGLWSVTGNIPPWEYRHRQ